MPAATRGRPPGSSATIFLLWCLVAGITFYWYAVLTGQGVEATASYMDFSRAFPPADTLLVVQAVVGLPRRNSARQPFTSFMPPSM